MIFGKGVVLSTLFACIAYEHQPLFLVMAISVLAVGSVVTMRLLVKVRRTVGALKGLWLVLSGFIAGATIWSTHFVAMLAYESTVILGYEPMLTLASLIVAMLITTFAFWVISSTQRSWIVELGGAVLGLGIVAMHYTGMAAMTVAGYTRWDWTWILVSVAFSVVFGAIAANRIARPITRFCKYGASLAFFFSVALMHFSGMAGLSIDPALVEQGATTLLSGFHLGAAIVAVVSLFLTCGFIMHMIDLRNTAQSSETQKHLALVDPLTGSANRLGCQQHLEHVIRTLPDATSRILVVAIDLNRFHNVNDVHGHSNGDAVLRELVERFNANLLSNEMIGRFDGDEFLAVKAGLYSDHQVREFCARIISIVQEPFDLDGERLEISASLGTALYPQDGSRARDIIDRAGMAMSRAKAQRATQAVSYDANMDEGKRKESKLAMDLAQALEKNELHLVFQLQNDANDLHICGVEALARWNHKDQGPISPGVFIPIAEESGLISALGDWALREACKQAASWKQPLKVAVNVASSQLADADFCRKVHEALLETKLPAHRLELEITESGIIADTVHALHVIRQLKTLGVNIAMDDYGTGYSSLSTLQNFPFDKIKIDREFVTEVHTRKQSAAIVKATILLGQSLDIPVLAEGVELEEQIEFLRQNGCNLVQGFLFGTPLTAGVLCELTEHAQFFAPVSAECRTEHQDAPKLKLSA